MKLLTLRNCGNDLQPMVSPSLYCFRLCFPSGVWFCLRPTSPCWPPRKLGARAPVCCSSCSGSVRRGGGVGTGPAPCSARTAVHYSDNCVWLIINQM